MIDTSPQERRRKAQELTQHRQLAQAREVEGFPELAFARRAVAERHVHQLVVLELRVSIRDLPCW
jgi:hypothetical protein